MPKLSDVPISPPVVSVNARRAVILLLVAAAALLAASLSGQVLKYRFNHDHVFGLVNLLNVDGEGNLPTWYSSATLLLCALLLGIIAWVRAVQERGAVGYWVGLAALFLYVSADEASFIHELLNPVLRQTRFLPGPLFYGWVIAGMAVAAGVGVVYARFVWRLSAPVRRAFIGAAVLYLGGALGVEMAGAAHAFRFGTDNLGYSLWTTIEEGMEMAGVAVFIYGLLLQLEAEGPVSLRVESRKEN